MRAVKDFVSAAQAAHELALDEPDGMVARTYAEMAQALEAAARVAAFASRSKALR
jgi:hypothetical protein